MPEDNGKNVKYYYTTEEQFAALVGTQEGQQSVKALAQHLADNKIDIPEEGYVVFQRASKFRRPKPRVTNSVIIESERKLGKRKPKETEATPSTDVAAPTE